MALTAEEVQEIFKTCLAAGDAVSNELSQRGFKGTSDEVAYHMVLVFFFVKAFKTYQAVQLLWRNGFEEDALILCRTIFEINLQSSYLTKDPDKHTMLFIEHDPVVRYRLYEDMKKIGGSSLVEYAESRADDLNQLRELHTRFANRHPKGKGWWGESIRWLAKELDEHYLRWYGYIYWEQSGLVHTGSHAMSRYVQETSSGVHLRCYPEKPDESTKVIDCSTLFFLGASLNAARALGLDSERIVVKAKDHYDDLWQKAVAAEKSRKTSDQIV